VILACVAQCSVCGESSMRLSGGEERGQAWVRVGAAYPVTRLVREAVGRGYSGLEFAEGIPGSVGGGADHECGRLRV